ncbi:MAG: translocation/assembly module TamB, partial [Bacteroidetes bacterium]|nr:translocation/assembly module TamB [Bacteroidota bacterium]
HLKNTDQLCDMFVSGARLSPDLIISGFLNTAGREFELNAKASDISMSGKALKELDARIVLSDKLLTTESHCRRFELNEDMGLNNFELNFEGYNDSILFDFHWINRDSLLYAGDVAALACLSRPEGYTTPAAKIKLIPSEFIFADQLWGIGESIITIDTFSIRINDFTLSNEGQLLNFFGSVSERENDSLYVAFSNINISNVNLLTKKAGLNFDGILNGQASLSDVYGDPVFYTNVDVDSFAINNEVLGDVAILSHWENPTQSINLIFRLKKGRIEPVVIAGNYIPKTQSLDFGITFDRLNLRIFAPYIEEYITDFKGRLNGDVELTGTLANPLLNGSIQLQKTSFIFNMMQTEYYMTNYIDIANSTIRFENMIIYDERGNQAVVAGAVYHKNYKDLFFDITLNADRFLFMNTTEKDNSTYYGTAVASGLVSVNGDPSNLVIDISARTEADTEFFIPLSTGEDVAEFRFISFVNKNITDIREEEEKEVDLSGVQLNFELEVTPDAEVQIIFDSKVGDIIRGRGTANLKMEINTLGRFNMYGDYVIESGDYLFTLQNVINKRFDVEKGGTIKWNGSPYDAYVDMNAIYHLKAPLYDLMAGLSLDSAEMNKYRRRVPVECKLQMSQTIMEPDIQFGIDVPMADDKVSGIINNLTSEEMNKQLLSLLVLNRFYTPSSMRGANTESSGTGAVGVTSSELLSNQLSHWLSQISNDFDIGVNYRPGDEITSDELEVALSTQLFNDRITINGNVGMGGQQNTSGLVGDFDVNLKLNRSGKLRLKAFTRSND